MALKGKKLVIIYSKNMVLKGEKTILRPIELKDAGIMTKWYSDPDIFRFISGRKTTLARQKKQIGLSIKDKDTFNFIIETKEGGPIGHLIFFLDKQNGSGSFGAAIGNKKYWHGGYARDAVKTIVKYGFETLKLNQIHLAGNGTCEKNISAIKTAENLGFKREGLHRDRVKLDGKYHNMIPMSILAKEWKKIRNS